MSAQNRISNLFVIFVFFLSGAVALIYEILWRRYLNELIGSTSLAEVVVLMIFLGGLSFGALLVGWLVDRWRNGLMMYGFLELGIGVYAIFFPDLFKQSNAIFLKIGSQLEFGSLSMFMWKFLVASLLILLPSIAMGGTLPAITRYLTKSREGVRGNVSMLYGFNTLGGVLGVLGCGFFLIYRYGLASSMFFAGVMNLALGATALIVALLYRLKILVEDGDDSDRQSPEEFQDSKIYPPYAVKRAFFAAGVGGFAAMALQVAWIRYFAFVLGATHSAFTIVVGAFILGLGLGALMVKSRKFGSIPLPTTLSFAFALTSVTIGIGLFFYGRVPFEMERFGSMIAHTPYSWPFHETLKFGFCFVLMLLPTMLSGMMLPVCIRIVGRGHGDLGKDVGKIYAINTIGALLGILITSQLFFRIFSLAESLRVIFFIYVSAAFFLAFILKEKGRKRMLILTSSVLLLNVFFWRPWPPLQLFLSRVDFIQTPDLTFSKFNEWNEEVYNLNNFNGPDAHVAVYDVLLEGNMELKTMLVNGKPDASASRNMDYPDMETQVLTAHIPMLLHTTPEKVFVLGLGSGVTTSEVLKFPEVKEVVTAELVAGVFEASKKFAEFNHRFWEDPRHRMVIEDGKNFMKLSEDKFDVIIAEPTNIWQSGMARLFSEDFFRLAKSRLEPGGVYAQWIQLYYVDDATIDIVLKTFSRVFPEASCFKVSPGDMLLVGYDQKWKFEPRQLEKRFNYPQVLAGERKFGNVNPLAFLLREVIGRENFHKYTASLKSQINTDDLPVLEKAAEYSQYINSGITTLAQHDSRVDPDSADLLLNDYLRDVDISPNSLRELIAASPRDLNDRLRISAGFKLMESYWNTYQTEKLHPSMVASVIHDRQLGEVVILPNYRKSPDQMSVDESFDVLRSELLVWKKAASQLWAPDETRLRKLYERFAAGVDRGIAVDVARDLGLALARDRICGAAQHFLRIAEEQGGLMPKDINRDDIGNVFACAVKNGEVGRSRYWLDVIEVNRLEVTPAIRQGKDLLTYKFGNSINDLST